MARGRGLSGVQSVTGKLQRSLQRSDQPPPGRPSRWRPGLEPHVPRPRGRSGDSTPGRHGHPDTLPPEHRVGHPGTWVPNPSAELSPGRVPETQHLLPGARLLGRCRHQPHRPAFTELPAGAGRVLHSRCGLHVAPPAPGRDSEVSPPAPHTHARAPSHGGLRLAQGRGWRMPGLLGPGAGRPAATRGQQTLREEPGRPGPALAHTEGGAAPTTALRPPGSPTWSPRAPVPTSAAASPRSGPSSGRPLIPMGAEREA